MKDPKKRHAGYPEWTSKEVRAAAHATGVSERQAYRWKSGESIPHPAALVILKERKLL